MESAIIELPTALSQLLDRLPDRAFSARLRKVYLAAAQAISRLSDIDLVRYETGTMDGSPDLALWEEMAPVIRDTVMDVNGLLSAIREQFVAGPAALEDARGAAGGARKDQQVSAMLKAGMNLIALQITELGELMRNPQVVSDRWNLLSELQRFRTRFREEIGDLVFDSSSVFEEIRREEAVPGHAEAVSAALLVRATAADLRRVVTARLKTLSEAEPEDIQWNAQQLEKELDLFGRTPAYATLRAQDKRAVIEFRQRLGELAASAGTGKAELLAAVQPFVELVVSLERVNKRALLLSHDREVLAACGVRLENAEQMLARDPVGAARGLAEATLTAQSLYGRDAELDAFLRRSRKTSLAALAGAELRQGLEQLRVLLAGMQF